MQAAEILDTFERLGITAYVKGDKLVVEPGSKLPPDLRPEIRERKAEIMALLSGSTACTCPRTIGAAGCGRDYPACTICGYTWRCKTCGGCRQCAAPGRQVRQTDEADLPFPIGNGGLDPAQVEMAERHNTRLGVVDPVERRLNVLFWLMQHYRQIGDTGMAGEVKAAYCSLRDADPDVVRLTCMGEMDEITLLKRLVNGQKWLTAQHQAWLDSKPDAASDERFSVALATWSEMERSLRLVFGYRPGGLSSLLPNTTKREASLVYHDTRQSTQGG
jgi:hypothetical protein